MNPVCDIYEILDAVVALSQVKVLFGELSELFAVDNVQKQSTLVPPPDLKSAIVAFT